MQWADVVNDPSLKNLPYKIELDQLGRILMTPHWPIHSELQSILQGALTQRLAGGRAVPEYAIQTSAGVRVADVAWRSDARWQTIQASGRGPAQIAPEICIEVLSSSNSDVEMVEKRALYFEAGALEVWICDETGRLRFFTPDGEVSRSHQVPTFPLHIEA